MAAAEPAPVLVFERRGQAFCSPTADVLEIVEEPALEDPGYPTPLVAGVMLYDGRFLPAVDPACVFDHPPERRGDAVLIQGPAGTVALLADSVLGFRTPTALAPTPWIPAGRICRAAAVIERIGRAFVLGADGLGDVPAAPVSAAAAGSRIAARLGEGGNDASPGGPMHLVFTIAGRVFAAAYTDVQRILYRQRLFPVPGAIPPIRHAVEVIGAVVPVLELAAPAAMPERGDFVVLTSSVGPLALRVDGIERPLPLVRDATEAGWFPSPGVAGIARMGERAYSLVTGETLLRDLVRDGGAQNIESQGMGIQSVAGGRAV